MEGKRNNDPWLPLTEEAPTTSQLPIVPAPRNPLTEMIDSERYIQTLERKLAHLKSKSEEPSSRDIISSLALFHDDQMRRYISEVNNFSLASSSRTDEPLPQASFVQRKLHPEKQPLSAEEIAELINEDLLSKVFEEAENNLDCVSVQNISDHGAHTLEVSKPSEDPAVLECTAITDDQLMQNSQENDSKAASGHMDEDWANFDELNQNIQAIDSSNVDELNQNIQAIDSSNVDELNQNIQAIDSSNS